MRSPTSSARLLPEAPRQTPLHPSPDIDQHRDGNVIARRPWPTVRSWPVVRDSRIARVPDGTNNRAAAAPSLSSPPPRSARQTRSWRRRAWRAEPATARPLAGRRRRSHVTDAVSLKPAAHVGCWNRLRTSSTMCGSTTAAANDRQLDLGSVRREAGALLRTPRERASGCRR